MYQSPLGGEWGLMCVCTYSDALERVSIPFGWGVGANARDVYKRQPTRPYQSPLGGEWGLINQPFVQAPAGMYQSPLGGEWGLI